MAAWWRELKAKWPSRPRRFLAVDFDSDSLRIVLAERAGKSARALRLVSAKMPPGVDIADGDAVGRALAAALEEAHLHESHVLMAVPRGQAVLKPLTLPANTAEAELPGMVRFQVEKQLPFAPAEAVIDFTVETHYAAEDSPREGVEVLAAAVRVPVVEHYRRIAEVAGLRLMGLRLRPAATAACVRACLPFERRARSLTVVHLTADEAEIEILEGDALTFSRSIAGAISPSGDADASGDEAANAVVTEVVRSLQSYYYQQHPRGVASRDILLAGGTGIERRVAELLGRQLGATCHMLDPAAGMGLRSEPSSPAFVAALGLAAGAYPPERAPLDFVSPKRAPTQRDKRKVRAAVIGAGAGAVVLALVIGAVAYLAAEGREVTALQGTKNDLTAKTKPLAEIRKRVGEVEAWTEASCDWLGHVANVTRLLPKAEDAYIDAFHTKTEARTVQFTVYARQSDVIESMGRRFQQAGYRFERKQSATTKDPRYIYSATVTVMAPKDMELKLPAAEPTSQEAGTS